MKLLKAYRKTYGRQFGISIFIAYLYFLSMLVFWAVNRYVEDAAFPAVPAITLLIFILQFWFRNKTPNAVFGVVGVIISIMAFVQKSPGVIFSEERSIIPPGVEYFCTMIMSGILVAGYFKHSEI
ncbi:hypothetical protein ACTHGU_05905 [Chitinophagaceae bacterium MMS25-I14]